MTATNEERILELLYEMQRTIDELKLMKSNPAQTEYMNLSDGARYMGAGVSSINKYIQEGLLPKYKRGGSVVVRRRDIDEFILSRRIPSQADIEYQANQIMYNNDRRRAAKGK